jgi:hypothetical protein
MKMVKSLLLGSAAGIVAIAGAQAADLPVKAKPVQYVKICSLYGAGFYYIPGTDTCLKLGGWVRTEYNFGSHGSFSPIVTGGDARYVRTSNDNTWRTRYVLTVDTRTQTEYGTLRTYIASGITTSNGNNAGGDVYNNRAFIQWAGFTMGLASSFYDFFQFSDVSNQTNIIGSDTGGNGIMVWAYTAQLGNGWSASLSLEDSAHSYRRNGIFSSDPGFAGGSSISGTGALNNNEYAGIGTRWPDIVGNIRLEQAWGSAQVMGAIHDVGATYYTSPFGPANNADNEWNGHPDDKVGFAVGGGFKWNFPWLGKGDHFAMQATYSKGATGYAGSGLPVGAFMIYSGQDVGVGPVLDGVYSSFPTQTSIELTEAWSVSAGFEHHWDAYWQTSLYGGYVEINYNDTATAYLNAAQFPNCGTQCPSWDSSFWQIGSRTVWTPVKGLDLSVDVMYNHLNTAWQGLPGGVVNLNPGGGKLAQDYNVSDQDVWQGIFRVQRNFYP